MNRRSLIQLSELYRQVSVDGRAAWVSASMMFEVGMCQNEREREREKKIIIVFHLISFHTKLERVRSKKEPPQVLSGCHMSILAGV